MANCLPDPQVPRSVCVNLPDPEDIQCIPDGWLAPSATKITNDNYEIIRCIIDRVGVLAGGGGAGGPYTTVDNGDGTVTVTDVGSGNPFTIDIDAIGNHVIPTAIDLAATGNANEYTISFTYTDEDGLPVVVTDATPIIISGAGLAVANQSLDSARTVDLNGQTLEFDAGASAVGVEFNGTGAKVATFNGDVDITGTLDPDGVQFTPLTSVAVAQAYFTGKGLNFDECVYLNAADGNIYRGSVSLESGGGGSDGVVTGVTVSGNDLDFTGTGGGFNGTVDVSTTTAVAANTAKISFAASDSAKLAGIEANATADQTGSEIKVAYEAEANTNAFTDAAQTKLGGIEALADITDATNVEAAGAVMETDTTTASMIFVIDEDNMVSDSATKIPTQQSVKAYVDSKGLTTNDPRLDGAGTLADPLIFRDWNGTQPITYTSTHTYLVGVWDTGEWESRRFVLSTGIKDGTANVTNNAGVLDDTTAYTTVQTLTYA